MSVPEKVPLDAGRLFAQPPLAGPRIEAWKLAPDGSRVFFLRGSAADDNRLDLWEYQIRRRCARRLAAAGSLAPAAQPLADEELARRERQRVAALSGILEYSVSPCGRELLVPLDGNLYYVDADGGSAGASADSGAATGPAAMRRIAPAASSATGASISPRGGHVAYVRDQNLFVYDLARDQERALTADGGGGIKNGSAEFVAQEEMNRHSGYWWSPDGRHIAFARVDETSVPSIERLEITADNVKSAAQRYPLAGGANVRISLGVVNIAGGATTWIALGADEDFYLARVNWLPDAKTLAIQRESRNQRRLDLLFADSASGAGRIVLTETSDSWIELHDELTFLQRADEFIWASNRDGFMHLYLYDHEGRLLRRLTAGDWNVDDFHARAVKAVDEARRLVYFTANAPNPTMRNLYVASLDSRDPARIRRISREDGVHAIAMSAAADIYVDQYTSRTQPPQLSLRERDGTLIAFIQENRLDEAHPYAPYSADDAVPQFGTLAADDGQTLWYRLFKPHDFDVNRRYPVIVDVYGGPGVARVLDEWTGGTFTQLLTRAGFLVWQLDNRGSGFRGTAFQAPIQGRLGEIEVADQIQGARWLASQPYVDAARIGVWGWSYGGYLSLMLLCKAADLFRAGVAGAPVTDWALYDTHYTERYLGRPQDNAAGYAASSVLPYAPALCGRLLLIHGMADDNVLFLHSIKLMRKLQDLGTAFDLMLYPGAKHGLTRQHDGRHAYATILRFFMANLG